MQLMDSKRLVTRVSRRHKRMMGGTLDWEQRSVCKGFVPLNRKEANL